MLSKIKTRLVLSFLGLAAALKSKAETARGNRIVAIKAEQLELVNKTNKRLLALDNFRKAVNKAIEGHSVKVTEKAAETHMTLEFAEMELKCK